MAAHVRLSLHDRLLHHGDGIESVEVRLGEPRDRRAGEDMYCLMQVHVRAAPAVTVVDVGAGTFATIERAAERVGRLAGAQLQAAKARPADASSREGASDDVPARLPRQRVRSQRHR